jgi:hypothetical protein
VDQDANLSAPDHGAGQTDAMVRLARPVHLDAEEMIGLVRPRLRLTTAVEWAGLVADLDAVVRHRRHDFRESSPAQGRDFRPSASAGEERAGFRLLPKFRETPLPAASAGREQVVPIAAVEKVANRLVPTRQVVVHQVVVRQMAAQVVGVVERRDALRDVAVSAAQLLPVSPEQRASRQAQQVSEQQEPQALVPE